MPKLPKNGWLHHCEQCKKITSRLIIIKHEKRTFYKYSCIKCRTNFINWLFLRFDYVIILNETTANLCLNV